MKVLFVCSANQFRSVAGHYSLQNYVEINNIPEFTVSSAGTIADSRLSNPRNVVMALQKYGIDISSHIQRRLTQQICDDADIIIAMGLDHQEFIQTIFKKKSYLFNEIAFGKKESVLDVHEFYTHGYTYEEGRLYVQKTVDYIHDSIPLFIQHLKKLKK